MDAKIKVNRSSHTDIMNNDGCKCSRSFHIAYSWATLLHQLKTKKYCFVLTCIAEMNVNSKTILTAFGREQKQ